MSARKPKQPIQKATPSPEAPSVELRDSLMHIFDDFITAHALVKVAHRHIEEWDDEARGAAVLVLGIGVQALDDFSDQLEGIRRAQKRTPTGDAS
jgi:hypothetical protein